MTSLKSYKWIPGNGPSQQAIERIRSRVQKPKEPMGEAWFMSIERRMFDELGNNEVVNNMPAMDLEFALFEISSGTSCFGHLPEWDEWFKYLLPTLIERSDENLYFENYLLQSVVTAFMSIYWDGLIEHYPGFREDALVSLPLTVMGEQFWSDDFGASRPVFLDLQEDGMGRIKLFWDAGTSDPNVSASLFFCLKYLRNDELPVWIESLVKIEHPLWQGNLMVWFLGVFDAFNRGTIWPDEVDDAKPKIEWEHSHVLGSKDTFPKFNDNRRFVPEENVRTFFQAMKDYYTEEKIIELAESFSQNEYIAQSTYKVPESLQSKLASQ